MFSLSIKFQVDGCFLLYFQGGTLLCMFGFHCFIEKLAVRLNFAALKMYPQLHALRGSISFIFNRFIYEIRRCGFLCRCPLYDFFNPYFNAIQQFEKILSY